MIRSQFFRLALLACALGAWTIVPAPNIASPDVEVYAAAIHHLFPEKRQLVIQETTEKIFQKTASASVLEVGDIFNPPFERIYRTPGFDSAAAKDLQNKMVEAYALGPVLDSLRRIFSGQVTFTVKSDWAALRKADPSPASRYPQPVGAYDLISVSSVGYNRDETQAVVSISYTCGGRCGQGRILALQKSAGKWEVTKILGTWVS